MYWLVCVVVVKGDKKAGSKQTSGKGGTVDVLAERPRALQVELSVELCVSSFTCHQDHQLATDDADADVVIVDNN